MNNLIKNLSLLAVVSLLAACGGNGNNGSKLEEGDTPATPPQAFSVRLDSVVVRRISNGDTISVDTEGVNSGSLTVASSAVTEKE
ncbi:MAG: hypothetical protein CSA49_03045 [Gammaproteobacteria bacterium]|nr:MAG: hypothetical protein CSA49_03045 [Gammaproteobacteria bacterium]